MEVFPARVVTNSATGGADSGGVGAPRSDEATGWRFRGGVPLDLRKWGLAPSLPAPAT